MREKSIRILENRFGPIDPELKGLSKDKKGELFRRATKNKGRGKLHCSGKNEGAVVPIKLTNSHSRANRPRGAIKMIFGQEHTEPQPDLRHFLRRSHQTRPPLRVTIGDIVGEKLRSLGLIFEVDDALDDREQSEVSGLNATESQIPLPEIF